MSAAERAGTPVVYMTTMDRDFMRELRKRHAETHDLHNNAMAAWEEMEKLQRLLTRQIFMANGENRVVTFSAGVAQRVEEEAPSETLSRADDAMYSAKQKGKNRVEIAGFY